MTRPPKMPEIIVAPLANAFIPVKSSLIAGLTVRSGFVTSSSMLRKCGKFGAGHKSMICNRHLRRHPQVFQSFLRHRDLDFAPLELLF
mmetsp:Transcript_17400/g.32798  ORF Transcript_17400/g.32798 Transcript_17400/m.32798 type:complete len:88 (+) Transcript_17400:27-290(+)